MHFLLQFSLEYRVKSMAIESVLETMHNVLHYHKIIIVIWHATDKYCNFSELR